MILVDANLLLYAYNSSDEHHEKARVWLEEVFSGHEPFGLSWPDHSRVPSYHNPSTPATSTIKSRSHVIVSEWLERPQRFFYYTGTSFRFEEMYVVDGAIRLASGC